MEKALQGFRDKRNELLVSESAGSDTGTSSGSPGTSSGSPSSGNGN